MDFLQILLAAGIPSAITGATISIILSRYFKKQEEKEKAREEINVLLIQGVGAAISLSEAVTIAYKNGKCNGETEKALTYAKESKHNITNFLTRKGVQSIV